MTDLGLAAALGVTFAAGLGVGLALAARQGARMRQVAEGVAELAGGNSAHRILMPGSDSASRIAEGMNVLADAMQMERETASARDEAQRRLLANVSHDLRTPIASIAGYVDALQRGLGSDPERYLAIIASKTDELAELTDDLFYEARLYAGDLELMLARVDLAEAVRRAILGFEPQFAARGIAVAVEIPERACAVNADASAVARILDNLISNALRHASGMTAFSVGVVAENGVCAVRLTNDGAELPSDIDRLFERGVVGGRGGAGFGLSIARELAGRMGASVGVESIGAGAVAFSLAFPAVVAER